MLCEICGRETCDCLLTNREYLLRKIGKTMCTLPIGEKVAVPSVNSGGELTNFFCDGKPDPDNPLNYYPTPHRVIAGLLDREQFKGTILEPAAGEGHIVDVLCNEGYTVVASDKKDGVDFYDLHKRVANIITNPDFREADRFIRHALALATDKVAMLLPWWMLEGNNHKDLWTTMPLKAIYFFSRRPQFTTENKSVVVVFWAVWQHGYKRQPTVGWL